MRKVTEKQNGRWGSCSFRRTESGNCKLRRSWLSRCDWFPIYLISHALPKGARDMSWHSISLELQMKTVRNCFEIKEYVDGWIHSNVVKKSHRNVYLYLQNGQRTRQKSCISLININLILMSKQILIETFSPQPQHFQRGILDFLNLMQEHTQ